MLSLISFALGGFLAARWYGNKVLFQGTRIDDYDSVKFPIKFKNGVSYIYDRPESDTVVIFSHGNGGNLTWREGIREFFAQTNYGFLIYDYYGYGASQSVPTILMNETALTRAVEEMAEITRDKNVILMGASLGCFPSCWLASRNPSNILGVILCVPFDSIGSIVKVSPYFLGSYDNFSLCKKIKVPTLLIRAKYDQIMPWSACDHLMEALGDGGHLITVPADHVGYLTEVTKKEIIRFIKYIDSSSTTK